MSTSTSKVQTMQLAEQINDEFLTCKICYEPFKDPKCLTCLHTFCEECIDQHVSAQRSYKYSDYREFSCPICRKKTVIPTGGVRKLNDNFLISSLSELLMSKKPSKTPNCEICRIVNQREREATSKCVECQKLMCRSCCSQHQQMKITTNHSIYELEIEKDIMCKKHPNELVRFYCEACETCVCIPCTYIDHRDHDLVDFKDGISHHKDTIEDNLRRCRIRIGEIRTRLDMLRQCEARILVAQNEIHAAALAFTDEIRTKEHALIAKLNDEYYGEETINYIKKKDEMETFLEQLKSTCSLTEVVVKGKDIEMLLLKKQLCDKFQEFQSIQLDPVPRNIFKKIMFVPGNVDLGDIKDPNEEHADKFSLTVNEDKEVFRGGRSGSTGSSYADASDDEKETVKGSDDKATQITPRDSREIAGDKIVEREVQTDIRMIHELATPNFRDRFARTQSTTLASRMDNKSVQTDEINEAVTTAAGASRPKLSSQSSVDDETPSSSSTSNNAPVDMNKLSRRVRRHVKPGCLLSVLPMNSDIVIIDPESNAITILDKRGKQRYGIANQQFKEMYGRLDRGVRFQTPQGILTIKLENDAKLLTETAQKAYENLPETSA